MTKSRAEDMKRSRQRRKEAGLVEFRVWVTPEQRDKLKDALRAILEAEHDSMMNKAIEMYSPVLDYLRKEVD